MEIYGRQKGLRGLVTVLLAVTVLTLSTGVTFAQDFFTDCTSNTGENATVSIPPGVPVMHTDLDYTPQANDEFAVFRPNPDGNPADDLCVGWGTWDPTTGIAITVWGNNSLTPETDGMLPGEVMEWRVWDRQGNRAFHTNVEYVDSFPFHPNGEYAANRLYQLQVFQPTAITFLQIQASTRSWGWVAGAVSLLILTGSVVLLRPQFVRRRQESNQVIV